MERLPMSTPPPPPPDASFCADGMACATRGGRQRGAGVQTPGGVRPRLRARRLAWQLAHEARPREGGEGAHRLVGIRGHPVDGHAGPPQWPASAQRRPGRVPCVAWVLRPAW